MRRFLAEKALPLDQAMQILGLKLGFTQADFDTAYKALVRQWHPDRPGGSTEKMAMINHAADTARDAVKNHRTGTAASSFDWKAHDEKMNAYAEVVRTKIEDTISLEAFERYFAKVFSEPFHADVTFNKRYKGGDSVSFRLTFENEPHTIVFTMDISVGLSKLANAKVLANPEHFMDMSILTSMLANRKSIKLTQRSWSMASEAKVLTDPELTFPAEKLKTQIKKSEGRKMAARDVLLTFSRELKAEVSGSGKDTWVYVPIGDYRVALYRMTMMGLASWGINGVYHEKKAGRIQQTKSFVSIHEDEKSMHWLWDKLKELQKVGATGYFHNDPGLLADKLDAMVLEYKNSSYSKRTE